MTLMMRRREFIIVLGGAATAWPRAAKAQQGGRVRRIAILERGADTERGAQVRQGAIREGLAKLGWIEGRNVRFDLRFSADDPDRLRVHADELVHLAPDVIAVNSAAATRALLQRTRTIPIVFANVGDPVANGLLKNISRPEGMPRGSQAPTRRSAANGWSCSRRRRRASPAPPSSSSPNTSTINTSA